MLHFATSKLSERELKKNTSNNCNILLQTVFQIKLVDKNMHTIKIFIRQHFFRVYSS